MLTYFRGGRVVRFLADWMFMHIPVIGRVIRMTEPIPVYTKPAFMGVGESYRLRQAGFRPVDACCAALERGESVGIFPEGTRNNSTTLRRGRRGLGFVVLRTGAPVVPVGIRFPAAREYGHVPRIGRMEVRVGEPLRFDQERDELAAGAGLDSEAAAALAQRIVDSVMVTLSQLCAKPYPVGERRANGAEGGTDGLSSD
jgi:1-acyl-sn-glycerol-3-phosphate acyltransferase